MPFRWTSRLMQLAVGPCSQCGQPVRDDSACCPSCGALQKMGLRQLAIRVAKKAWLGAILGMIAGVVCAVPLYLVQPLLAHRAQITFHGMWRIAELWAVIGAMLGAVCRGSWEAYRND